MTGWQSGIGGGTGMRNEGYLFNRVGSLGQPGLTLNLSATQKRGGRRDRSHCRCQEVGTLSGRQTMVEMSKPADIVHKRAVKWLVSEAP